VTIVVEAQFDALLCSPFSATLGSAGAKVGFANFRGAPVADMFYPAALADALSGSNINSENDIKATFSSALDGGSCMGGRTFYLGFDHNPGNNLDLLAVVLHELGHGLGFMSVMKADGTSSLSSGRLAIYDRFLYSEVAGQFLTDMASSERRAALVGGTALVWNSSSVNSQASLLTGGVSSAGGHLRIYAPFSYNDGASTSHWDTSAQWSINGSQRQLLMEPYITANPRGHTDLTGCSLRDMGWLGTRCPDTVGTNFLPVAQPQTAFGTEDTLTQITLTGTDSDGPSALSYTIVSSPLHGTLTNPMGTADAGGADLSYTPATDFYGVDTFSYLVNDGSDDSAAATVAISIAAVNDAPVANAQAVSATTNTAVTITLRGTDIEGAPLTYRIATEPSNGVLSGDGAVRTYTPNSSFVGTDSFTFYVNDGSLNSFKASVGISVAEPVPANGGGGGAMGWLSLIALLTVASWRLITMPQNAQGTL
jgi:hypothetical protein